MKKIVSFALIVVMLLGLYTMAQAEPFYLEEAGVTIEVPEGMTGQDMSSDGNYALGIGVGIGTGILMIIVRALLWRLRERRKGGA